LRLVKLKDLQSGKIKSCGCADREFTRICHELANLGETIKGDNNVVSFISKFKELQRARNNIIEFCDDVGY